MNRGTRFFIALGLWAALAWQTIGCTGRWPGEVGDDADPSTLPDRPHGGES